MPLIAMVKSRVASWKSKLLSFGGKSKTPPKVKSFPMCFTSKQTSYESGSQEKRLSGTRWLLLVRRNSNVGGKETHFLGLHLLLGVLDSFIWLSQPWTHPEHN